MKNTPMKFFNETAHPGEFLSLAMPLPQLFSCAPMYMPIKVVHGKEQGPCFLIIAAMYGNEINGTEIINRLLNLPVMKKLKGTLIAVPVLNVLGLINRTRFLPGGIDISRQFPGHPHGTHAQRLAHLFTTEIFSKADYCINLQTGPINHCNLSMIELYSNSKPVHDMAQVFNAPMIVKIEDIEKNTLAELAVQSNKPYFTYVGGEALRFDHNAIKVGIDGLLNMFRKLGMIGEKEAFIQNIQPSPVANNLMWVTAPMSGINHSKQKMGKLIKKNDPLCVIKDPFGTADNYILKSPKEGVLVAINNNPLIHEGDSLFQLALFPEAELAVDQLEIWQQEQQVATVNA